MKKIYLAAIAGNLGMLTVGQYFGWASPTLPILMQGKDETYPVRLTSEEASWVSSLLMLGAMAGCVICVFIVNVIGRKNTMLFAAVPSITSWLMIAFATSSWELYISRFLAGLSTESPYQLMRRNARQKAINSLIQLRGESDVYKEADDIERSVQVDLTNNTGFRELLCMPGNRRALITVISLNAIHQMSGVQAVEQYAELIFDQTNNKLDGKYLTMILGTVQVICTIICMFITDRSGRKSLLIISAIGSACSTAMVATYFQLQHNHVNTSNLTWLPAVGVIMYVIMFSVGLSPLPIAMIGELFPTNVKALGSTVTVIAAGVIAFSVTKLYLIIADNFGIHIPFWIFTACSLAGALFTFLYVPETKGKTLQQIQKELHGSSGVKKNFRKKYFRVSFFC
ncbi:facilitated trehalose transporter Tret1-like isoform X3 [Anoplolepis gracilipes]|uniref:facilitated trehalose transporter Tret1-like isoform X3 n=1 Tax=Anoplolepis gracilipes TaxID=354296 RepID=UPI003BA35198